MSSWTAPNAAERKTILDETASIAILGASANPSRASSFVLTYLRSSLCNYRVYAINPRETEIQGEPCYPDLAALPEVPDMVDVFRKPADCVEVTNQAIAVGAKSVWLQLGVLNDEAMQLAHAAGLAAVQDRCTKIEHARFDGGLNLAGFNTGIINSKRRT